MFYLFRGVVRILLLHTIRVGDGNRDVNVFSSEPFILLPFLNRKAVKGVGWLTGVALSCVLLNRSACAEDSLLS